MWRCNADTARSLGIAAGDTVRLTTRRGSIDVPARLSRDIRLDTLFVPFHWAGRPVRNLLTNAALDPLSRIPEFKACAVHIERVDVKRGAASAAASRRPAPRPPA